MPRADWKQAERDCNSQDEADLGQKGACGRTLCQVQKILQSREEPTPGADPEEATGILTNRSGWPVLFSTSASAEEGATVAAVMSELLGLC